jgi:hypothetical protein
VHATLCDFVLDIAQNSHEAGASHIKIDFIETERELSVSVADDGSGMTEGELEKALDPFCSDGRKHAARRVGLGIPFLIQTLEMTGGRRELASEKGKGTRFAFAFDLGHVDTPPLGDPAALFLAALTMDGDYELEIHRAREPAPGKAGGGEPLDYRLSRSELREAAGGLNDAAAIALVRAFLRSQEGARA